MENYDLILASASPRRAEILRQMGVSYRKVPANIDESVWPQELDVDYVQRMAMEKAHFELEKINAPAPRIAQFCCTLVLAWPDGTDAVFEGIMPGQVIWPMRGDQGHGYDPIFQPDGYNVTFAEMDRWEKNRISHRARAFEKLIRECFGG